MVRDIADAFFFVCLFVLHSYSTRVQFTVCFYLKSAILEWKHGPMICHGLIHSALEKGGAPEHCNILMTSSYGVIPQKMIL